jgi:chloramphenicol-sensitive protein RarD
MRWFVRGAQKIPLKDLGMLQYLSPSIMFLLALGFGEERITIADALSFPLLWLGIAVCVGMPFVARMLRMKTSPA